MASAAITVTETPATIESDTNAAVVTKGTLAGYIVNGGTVKTFVAFGTVTVVTTDAQLNGIIGLPAGASTPVPANVLTFNHKTASSSTVLYWIPALRS